MLRLGYKIRSLRKQNNMTLKDLSNKINLSISFLSGIERDMYSPSLETISNISDIFKITISELLGEKHKHRISVIGKKDKRVVVSEDKRVMVEFLSKPATLDTRIELKMVKMEPMFKNEKFHHSHSGEEIIHVLEGQVYMNIGGHIYNFEKGDTVHFDANIMHSFENRRNKPVRILVCTSPPNFTPIVPLSKKV